MERVKFVKMEIGDDLVLSFVVPRQGDPSDIESLVLLRTPKFEPAVQEGLRGVRVAIERYDDDEWDFLEKFEYVEAEAIVRVQTYSRRYKLDVRKLDANELVQMRKVMKKMNFDQRFKTAGV